MRLFKVESHLVVGIFPFPKIPYYRQELEKIIDNILLQLHVTIEVKVYLDDIESQIFKVRKYKREIEFKKINRS